MSRATDILDQIAQDPEAYFLARNRADEAKLYKMDLAAARQEGRAEGKAKAKAELLLKLLTLRFGPLSEAARTRLQSASEAELDAWAERVLTAQTLDEVLAP